MKKQKLLYKRRITATGFKINKNGVPVNRFGQNIMSSKIVRTLK